MDVRTQLVGLDCSVCKKRISYAPDAIGCSDCSKAYHKGCIQDGAICPSCGDDLLEQNAENTQKDLEAVAEKLKSGKRLFFIAVALHGGILLLNAFGSLFIPDIPELMRINPWTSLVGNAAIIVAVWYGYMIAKVILGVQFGIGLIFQIGMAQNLYLDSGWVGVGVSAFILAILSLCLFLFCISPKVAYYVESHRRHKEF